MEKKEKKEKKVGQIVDSYCGRCKLDRAHTIMVMDDETIAKVRCNVCGGSHKLRSAPEPGKGRKSTGKSGPIDPATAQSIWEACLAEATGTGKEYSMIAKYRVGDIVDHFAFGRGVVMKLYANKCDMLFKDKSRLMVSTNQ